MLFFVNVAFVHASYLPRSLAPMQDRTKTGSPCRFLHHAEDLRGSGVELEWELGALRQSKDTKKGLFGHFENHTLKWLPAQFVPVVHRKERATPERRQTFGPLLLSPIPDGLFGATPATSKQQAAARSQRPYGPKGTWSPLGKGTKGGQGKPGTADRNGALERRVRHRCVLLPMSAAAVRLGTGASGKSRSHRGLAGLAARDAAH